MPRSSRPYLIGKRAFDLAVCLLIFPVLVPLLLRCALAIFLDSPTRPILLAQTRTGRDGIPFCMLKFRTKVPNPEALKPPLAHLNERPFTGLWQVKGRNRTDFDERLRLDIEYMRHRSLALDLKILLQTVPAVRKRSGA
jgi:lipopolysaccharide/colanic/teichoic acid biosynthesis glycosyltransferase